MFSARQSRAMIRATATRGCLRVPYLPTLCCTVAVLGAVGVISASLASAAPSPKQLAARACAGKRSALAALTARDYRVLRRYVPCVLRDFLGHRPGAISAGWNEYLASTMAAFEKAPKRDETSAYVNTISTRKAHPVLSRIEPEQFHDCAKLSMREGDTTPPPLTLASVASQIQLAIAVIPPGATWETWGFYVGHRPIFHDGPKNNIDWAVAGVAGAAGC